MKLLHSRFEVSARVLYGMALAVALLLVFSLQPALAQTVTSSLTGTVADTSGASVPGAKVVLTNEGTNASQSTTASGVGYFSFTAILPGTYTLTISAKGFEAWREKGITIYQQESRSVPNIARPPPVAPASARVCRHGVGWSSSGSPCSSASARRR